MKQAPLLSAALALCLVLPAVQTFSADAIPDFLWARQGSGVDSDAASAVAVDASGNTYVTGYFGSAATFGSVNLTSSGDTDIFIAKYNTSGTLIWAKRAGGTGSDAGASVSVDSSGNVFVTGQFSGTATFDNITVRSGGDLDIFIAKYDASGNAVWVRRAGGSGLDGGAGIIADSNSNVYITGQFSGVATFAGTTLISSGETDIFIAKYDATGNQLWVRKAGGEDFDGGSAIALDHLGNPHITGFFTGTAIFSATSLTSSGSADAFVAKYDSSGKLIWVQKGGGSADDYGYGIGLDGFDNVFVTGSFRDKASFGGTSISATSLGDSDGFLAQFSSAGQALWVRQAGGTLTDSGNSLAVSAAGDAYIAGSFEGTMTIGTTNLTSSGSSDMFVAKYTGSNFVWAVQGGSSRFDSADGLAVDGAGDAYVAGLFSGVGTFGATVLSSSRYEDSVVFKLAADKIPQIITNPVGQVVLPGTTITLSATATGTLPLSYFWYQNGAPISGQTSSTLTLSNLTTANSGIYKVVATNIFGAVESQRATVTVTDRRVFVEDTLGFSGDQLPVPISLDGLGNENTVSFSVAFDSSLLKYVTNGFGAFTNISIVINTNQASSGRLGGILSLPASKQFSAGTNQLIKLYFQAATGLATSNFTTVSFTSSPVSLEVVAPDASSQAAVFQDGIVRIEDGLEADVSPRSSGDRLLTTADLALIGRYVAGLSTVTNASEFARADCAPISTRGDGKLSAQDWTQAGRYVAGLDKSQTTGGPTNPIVSASSLSGSQSVTLLAAGSTARKVKLGDPIQVNGKISVPVQIQSLGNENSFGFSLNFDSSVLQYVNVTPGSDSPLGLFIPNDRDAALGHIGILAGLSAGQVLSKGTHTLAVLEFAVKPGAATGKSTITFADTPVYREIVSADVAVMPAQYADGSVNIDGSVVAAPAATSRWLSNGNLELSWPGNGNYQVEVSTDLANWQVVAQLSSVQGTVRFVDEEIKTHPIRFYRLISR